MDTPLVAPACAISPTLPPHASRVAPAAFDRPAPRALDTRVAQLSAELVAADEAARRHLAGELHDGLGADLTALRFALENVDTWLAEHAPEGARRALALAQQALDAATRTTRGLIEAQDTSAVDAGLAAGLAEWIDAYAARTGVAASFACAAGARLARLSQPGALAVFRVAQEALSNVARHARASTSSIRLDATDSHLVLVVTDDGRGLSATRRRGYGIGSMRARCEAFGGSFELRASAAGRGTTLCARFAWAALAAQRATPRRVSHHS